MLNISREKQVKQLISRQLKFWQTTHSKNRQNEKAIVCPCLTISREIGSRGANWPKA